MFHFTVILEDTLLIATDVGPDPRTPEDLAAGKPFPPSLNVVCTDQLTGKVATGKWTVEQLCAVLTLAQGAGEEKWDGYWPEKLYAVVEPLFKDWPTECRPVP